MNFTKTMMAGALAAMTLFGASAANAALINSYDFTADLTDTLGAGNTLTASGGTVTGGRYDFGLNEGLRLTNALGDTFAYAIEVGLSVIDSISGFNKLIDFQDLSAATKRSDSGLYVQGGGIRFFNSPGPDGSVSLNTDFVAGLERLSDGTLNIYLDGVLIRTTTDSENSSVSGVNQAVSDTNVLNFFEDELFGAGQGEAFVGSADFIRIHDDASTFGQAPAVSAVPLPAALPLLLLSLGTLGAFRGYRKS
jgi:hypothetical protein